MARKRRRRWRFTSYLARQRAKKLEGKVTLPVGLRVYASVQVETPEPDQLPRKRWEWVTVETRLGKKGYQVCVSQNSDVPLVKKRLSEIYVKPVRIPGMKPAARWMRAGVAGHRMSRLWWYEGFEPMRVATELEVFAYEFGFVPASNWRLLNAEENFVWVRDGVAEEEENGPIYAPRNFEEKVHPFTPDATQREMTSEEKWLARQEKLSVTVRKRAAHAAEMADNWERVAKRAEKKARAWRRKADRYAKKLEETS